MNVSGIIWNQSVCLSMCLCVYPVIRLCVRVSVCLCTKYYFLQSAGRVIKSHSVTVLDSSCSKFNAFKSDKCGMILLKRKEGF